MKEMEQHPERIIELHGFLDRIPESVSYERTIREAIQKECDSDVRSHDALLS